MARAAADDLMQGFRFHVIAKNVANENPLAFSTPDDFEGGGEAGFQSVTLPELSVEPVEYREGTFKWTQKYVGPPTVSDCTLMQGVARTNTTFHDWVMTSVDGAEYRCDVTIFHYHRTEMGTANAVDGDDSVRRIECKNCIPTRAKPAGDFDSMAGEVSLAEVDFAMESFTVETS